VRVTLREVRPAVWRRILVPGDIDLGRLHGVLQAGSALPFDRPH
jgi:hypothetical protein